ncbi:hypothetical protein I546_3481 [Mycobacterium kansasii 732]|nr:hypothetical protein I546_3481 [Mycobacterium kansasii 732]
MALDSVLVMGAFGIVGSSPASQCLLSPDLLSEMRATSRLAVLTRIGRGAVIVGVCPELRSRHP